MGERGGVEGERCDTGVGLHNSNTVGLQINREDDMSGGRAIVYRPREGFSLGVCCCCQEAIERTVYQLRLY
jgi:hypothetical protein